MSNGPLSGIKVVEIAGIGPAPVAGMMLADMGAEVIVVERRNPNANAANISSSANSQAFFNRGKQSIALDLKDSQAVEIVLRLVEKADILIEGFRPGVMERLGLGPDVCMKRNKRLVYGRMTGWGQDGPLSQAAGHDPNYIALSGALFHGASRERPPTAPLTLVGDTGGGTMVLLFGLLSAVIHAGKTAEGQVVDCAITDGSAYISTLLRMMHNTAQISDEPGTGWPDFASPWHDTYQCSDDHYVTVCALEPQFYQTLLEKLGQTDNPLFANQWDMARWAEGKTQLEKIFRSRSRQQWCDLLEGTDACFAPVLNMTEAAKHPHNIARETFIEIDGVVQPAPAPKFSVSNPVPGRVPEAGQHTDEILLSIGYDEKALQRLAGLAVI